MEAVGRRRGRTACRVLHVYKCLETNVIYVILELVLGSARPFELLFDIRQSLYFSCGGVLPSFTTLLLNFDQLPGPTLYKKLLISRLISRKRFLNYFILF